MCNPGVRARHGAVAQIDGRPVLQPASNRVLTPEPGRSLKKSPPLKPVAFTLLPVPPCPSANENAAGGGVGVVVITSRPKAAAETVEKSDGDNSTRGFISTGKKPLSPKAAVKPAPAAKKKPKKSSHPWTSPFAAHEKVTVPGSIAAAQREKTTLMQAQRKMRIAHYGRVPGKVVPLSSSPPGSMDGGSNEESNRCCLITSNSGKSWPVLCFQP